MVNQEVKAYMLKSAKKYYNNLITMKFTLWEGTISSAYEAGFEDGCSLGMLEGRIAACEFADSYTDNAYAGIRAEKSAIEQELALALKERVK